MGRMERSFTVEAVLVALYLGAIVAANWAVSTFGQAALPFTAFLLIPFDLVTRDVLHERWEKRELWFHMLCLVSAGSVISYALAAATPRVAIASAVAFACAGGVDAVSYHLLGHWGTAVRMNGSNAFSSVVDSIVFPLIAFSVVNPSLSAAQAASKFVGGIVWSVVYIIFSRRCYNVFRK